MTDKDGNVTISDANYTVRSSSLYGNPYLFTGRRVDILDYGSLKIQYNRNRYYDYYTGRWLTHDPAGYVDGMNLYEYVASNPIRNFDPDGNKRRCPKCRGPYWEVRRWRGGPPPGFAYTGVTYHDWNVKLSTTSRGCPTGCCRLKLEECSCRIWGWYAGRPLQHWMKYPNGTTPEQHEKKHARQIKWWWSNVRAAVDAEQTRRCMRAEKTYCFLEAFDLSIKAFRKFLSAEAYQFDCDVYWDSPEKDKACRMAVDLEAKGDDLILKFFVKALECLAMD